MSSGDYRYEPCPRCGHQYDEHTGEIIEGYECPCCALTIDDETLGHHQVGNPP